MSEPKSSKPSLDVAVFSDYTCPWCYIGAARVDRLRHELADVVDLRIEWKAFEIHPEIPSDGLPVSALGYSEEQWRAMTDNLRRQAEMEGLIIAEHSRLANTHEALAAGEYAQAEEPARFADFHLALFHAYFGESRNIADRAVLADVAGAAGLDVDRLLAALRTGRYEPTLSENTAAARRLGVTGTPTFIFGGRYAAVGAHPVEELKRAVEMVLAH